MSNTINELLNEAVKKLSGIDTARLDAELILGKVINKNKLYLLMNKQQVIDDRLVKEYYRLIDKRKNKMPVKYILGVCDFYGLDFYVEEGVLIPRSDTEILVSEVIDIIKETNENNNIKKISICDLCSGSGAIGIAIAKNIPNAYVDEIDYYDIPEKVTKINIKNNMLSDRVNFIKSNLLDEIKDKKYDIIVSNPPYIKKTDIATLMRDVKDYEPHSALDGGYDGLDFYRKIIIDSKDVLTKDGILAFEIGYDQAKEVKSLLECAGYSSVKIIKDLSNHDRVVTAKLSI